jgi:hypothetical protein
VASGSGGSFADPELWVVEGNGAADGGAPLGLAAPPLVDHGGDGEDDEESDGTEHDGPQD